MPVSDLRGREESAAGQPAKSTPPVSSTPSGEQDAVISASEILSDPVMPRSNRSGRLLERIIFSSRHDDAIAGGKVPTRHESDIFVPKDLRPAGVDRPQSEGGDELESMGQQTSRMMLQMFLVGLMIFITLALCVVYAIKFCLCRRRKAARMLMRRALVGDLATSQHGIGTGSRLADNFLLTECACHHQHNPALPPAHLNDRIDGYHYFSGAAHALEPGSPIQNRNSMILTLIQRLQQTLMASHSDGDTRANGVQSADTNQQQQQQEQQHQLAELIAAQLQAQLIASGWLQSTCLCQQHQLMAQVPSAPPPSQRPPAYNELFRQQQQQHQRQVSPSAPTQQVVAHGGPLDNGSSRSSTSDQEEDNAVGRAL